MLWGFMHFWVLPSLMHIQQKRRQKIEEVIHTAKELEVKAQKMMQETYQAHQDLKLTLQERLRQTEEKAQKDYEEHTQKIDQGIEERLTAFKHDLERLKQNFTGNLETDIKKCVAVLQEVVKR
jgi:F0F1-type ATP synthase membrane subunit b/b'